MAVEIHPAPETLAAFARGDLPATELSAVAEHVSGCEACLASLEALPDDSLAALARASARPDEPAPTALASMPALPDGLPDGLIDHPRYRVISELGAGGMGVVYKAEDQFMGRAVALKVMAPSLTAKASAVERFRKEVRAAAQLNHPNIVIAHDTGEAGGRHFLVMEFVEGASLDRVVARKGPLPIPMAAHFTRQAAQGLQHASEKGMVHRDIKPQNLMVNKRGHIKIMDFGLARFASADDEPTPSGRLPFGAAKMVVDATTNPHLLLGTPDYLSPEQARNSHDVDTRSDVYSLGCTLYFLLTGRAPFAKAESLIDKLVAHTEQQPPPVQSLRREVPEGLASVLAKMMAKRPRDRYATPGDAASALSPFSKGTGSGGNLGDAPAAVAEPAGFEVVDAVVIAPSHSETPRPAKTPSAAAFAFDTPAEPQGATLVEPTRVRKTKRSKRLVPWWKRKGTIVGAAIAACALLVGGIIAAGGKKKDETPPDNGGSAKLAPGPGPSSSQPKGKDEGRRGNGTGKTKDLKVLFVVPSDGVYGPDYFPVKTRLEQEVKVVTASGKASSSPRCTATCGRRSRGAETRGRGFKRLRGHRLLRVQHRRVCRIRPGAYAVVSNCSTRCRNRRSRSRRSVSVSVCLSCNERVERKERPRRESRTREDRIRGGSQESRASN